MNTETEIVCKDLYDNNENIYFFWGLLAKDASDADSLASTLESQTYELFRGADLGTVCEALLENALRNVDWKEVADYIMEDVKDRSE